MWHVYKLLLLLKNNNSLYSARYCPDREIHTYTDTGTRNTILWFKKQTKQNKNSDRWPLRARLCRARPEISLSRGVKLRACHRYQFSITKFQVNRLNWAGQSRSNLPKQKELNWIKRSASHVCPGILVFLFSVVRHISISLFFFLSCLFTEWTVGSVFVAVFPSSFLFFFSARFCCCCCSLVHPSRPPPPARPPLSLSL